MPDSAVDLQVIAHASTMAICGALLSVIFWQLHRTYRAPHLACWTLAWLAFAIAQVLGGALLHLWYSFEAQTLVRSLVSVATQSLNLAYACFMLLGTAALLRQRPVVWRTKWLALGGIVLGVSIATLLTIDTSREVRMLVRVGLRNLITGIAFLGAAVALLRHRQPTRGLGRRVVTASFAALGVLCVYHGTLMIGPAQPAPTLYGGGVLDQLDMIAQCFVGLGLVIWALDEQNAIAEQRARELHDRTRQLFASQKMEAIGRLAGGVAHDFNNILTVIVANADHVLQRGDLGEPARGGLQEIRQAATQATRLTSQLLALASNRQGEARVVDLVVAVQGMVSVLRRLIGERIVLATDLGDTPLRVRLGQGHAEQVLLNLVVNARDAIAAQGTIRVRLAVEGADDQRRVVLAVADDGSGMTDEVRQRAMEPFFTTKGSGGTGLGLALVYGIAQQSSGAVEIDSAPGRGTVVRVAWPEAVGSAEEHDTTRSAAVGESRTVLLAEDEPSVREITARTLQHAGYKVLVAADAEAAQRLASEHREHIDILLTDVLMPGMNGPQLAEIVRRRRPTIRVLFVSGYVDARSRAQMPADAPLLQKPFTRKQLLAFVGDPLGATA